MDAIEPLAQDQDMLKIGSMARQFKWLKPSLAGLFLLSWASAVTGGEKRLLVADFEQPSARLPQGWILEGSGVARIADGALQLRETPDGVGAVLWTEADWPQNIRLSFEVSFSNNQGIGVVFIAAKAADGGDALRDTPKRTGAYDEYIRGKLHSYSLSLHRYWPDGRNNPGSNLRRNSGFHLLSQALPDPCLEANRRYHVEITKKGAHLIVKVDGKTIHEVEDDGAHGPAHGSGKIGFRIRGDASCIMSLHAIRLWQLDIGPMAPGRA